MHTVELTELRVAFKQIRLARYEAALLQFANSPQAAYRYCKLVRGQELLQIERPGNFFEDLVRLFSNRFGRKG